MQRIIDDFSGTIKDFVERTDYWWVLVSAILTIVFWDKLDSRVRIILIAFLIISFGLVIYAKDPRRLCYTQRNIGIAIKELQINGKKYDKLTLTQIAIWNAGSKKIDGHKIDDNKPLKIKILSPYEIIDLDVLDRTEKTKFGYVDQTPTEAKIKFSCLKPNEGGSIQVIHTGKLNDESIQLVGEIQGFKIEFVPYSQSRSNIPIYAIAFTSGLLASISSLIVSIRLNTGIYLGLTSFKFMAFSFLANITLMLCLAELIIYGRISRIPQEFKNFHNQLWEPKK